MRSATRTGWHEVCHKNKNFGMRSATRTGWHEVCHKNRPLEEERERRKGNLSNMAMLFTMMSWLKQYVAA